MQGMSMQGRSGHGLTMRTVLVAMGAMIMLSACAPMRQSSAPVESRTISKAVPPVPRSTPPGQAPAQATTPPQAPAAASATSSTTATPSATAAPEGFYRVRRGDTLIGISLDHGVAWRDLANWNQLDNPNLIEVDQLLRVRPPVSAVPPSTTVASIPAPAASVPAPAVVPTRPSVPDRATERPTDRPVERAPARPAATDSMMLSWPSRGAVITPFADPGYKGIAIAGAEGDPITAAGDGRVVYSGNGLRGYGNLVIVKHDGDFLTAYAHNRVILVSEGQTVKRGQKIAELGKTDSDVPKLHFEVRRSGKPVDPMKYLAQR